MIRFKAVIAIVICCFSHIAFGQYSIHGKLSTNGDSTAVKDCKVTLNNGEYTTQTDESGRFEFLNLPDGSYVFQVTSDAYMPVEHTIKIKGRSRQVSFGLTPSHRELNEVVLKGKASELGPSHLKAVDNFGIYEGKKSEIITPDKLVANLSTNNARQIYSRVAGLNIWENDGAGLQLSVGGRGLDPNRTSNFNVRQNGYDISADALGYPESYYTPPIEGVERIQIVRGAASLQYGTQFGGLLNFIMKKPVADKKFQLLARQTVGSFGFYNTFTSVSGTIKKLSYYSFFQYKTGNGWRPNSDFNNYNFYSNVNYKLSEKSIVGIDLTLMSYLAHQPGGLSDAMYKEDPRQSNRERNWFQVNWNMLAFHFTHKFNATNEFNLRVFGLYALRNSIGFRPFRVATIDDNSARDLIKGTFQNWGAEARYLKRYTFFKLPSVLLVGTRYYHGYNKASQGFGSTGKGADFNFVDPANTITYDYDFLNNNAAAFAENIFYLGEKLTVTPGLRYEYIHTTANGFYGFIVPDLTGAGKRYITNESRANGRSFVIGGIGVSYKPATKVNVYANISQNYRSITYSDMRISNPSAVIDPNMKDERGYSFDLGVRSEQTKLYNYDVSAFYLNYNNRIGEVQGYDNKDRVIRVRGNIGQAVVIGIESYVESDLLKVLKPDTKNWSAVLFANTALLHSEYKASENAEVVGNRVEFVPAVNIKTGTRVGYKNIKASFQYTYLSDQFSDGTNAVEGGVSAVIGLIPSYHIMDFSCSYEYKRYKIEGSINNLSNQFYFTRRATAYPGPGILPSDGRAFYFTLQVKI